MGSGGGVERSLQVDAEDVASYYWQAQQWARELRTGSERASVFEQLTGEPRSSVSCRGNSQAWPPVQKVGGWGLAELR